MSNTPQQVRASPGPTSAELDRTLEEKDTHTEWRRLNDEDQCECGRACLPGGDWCGECVG